MLLRLLLLLLLSCRMTHTSEICRVSFMETADLHRTESQSSLVPRACLQLPPGGAGQGGGVHTGVPPWVTDHPPTISGTL